MRDITNNAKRARFSSVKDATQAQVLNSEILFKTENNSKKQKEVLFFFKSPNGRKVINSSCVIMHKSGVY